MAAITNKYDRQLRIWGPHGQERLEKASICLLNCDPVGVETLKNLILPGIGHVAFVDSAKVTDRDLGNNFFITTDSVGQNRAEVVAKNLLEMNEDVKGEAISTDIAAWITPENVSKHTVIIASNLELDLNTKLAEVVEKTGKILVILQTVGLVGRIRVWGPQHFVIDEHPEGEKPDFRILEPFPALAAYCDKINLDTLEAKEHKHTPYVVILRKAISKYQAEHGGNIPITFPQKDEFKKLIKSMEKYEGEENFREAGLQSYHGYKNVHEIPDNLVKIFQEKSVLEAGPSSPDFVSFAKAVKIFVDKHGVTPLRGSLPDMTASTQNYIDLQTIYKNKAEEDKKEILKYWEEITGRKADSIKPDDLTFFYNNISTFSIITFRTLAEEYNTPISIENFETDAYKWYFGLRAVEKFRAKHHKYPSPESKDELDKIAREIIATHKDILPIEPAIIEELCRFEDSQLHNTGAILGGMASTEIIKLITSQFTPINHTFIYNGIQGSSTVYDI